MKTGTEAFTSSAIASNNILTGWGNHTLEIYLASLLYSDELPAPPFYKLVTNIT
jgi:hypothetical protein